MQKYFSSELIGVSQDDLIKYMDFLINKGQLEIEENTKSKITALELCYGDINVTITPSTPLIEVVKRNYAKEFLVFQDEDNEARYIEYFELKVDKLKQLFSENNSFSSETGIPNLLSEIVSEYLIDDLYLKEHHHAQNQQYIEQLQRKHNINSGMLNCLSMDLTKYPTKEEYIEKQKQKDAKTKKDDDEYFYVTKKELIKFAYKIDKSLNDTFDIEISIYTEQKLKTLNTVLKTLYFEDSIKRFQKVRKYDLPSKSIPLLATFLLSTDYMISYMHKIQKRILI